MGDLIKMGKRSTTDESVPQLPRVIWEHKVGSTAYRVVYGPNNYRKFEQSGKVDAMNNPIWESYGATPETVLEYMGRQRLEEIIAELS